MKPEELACIRERDRIAERCATCVERQYGQADPDDYIHKSVAECEAEMTRLDGKPRHCDKPEEHHTFVAGGLPPFSETAEVDRRALLGALDNLQARFDVISGLLGAVARVAGHVDDPEVVAALDRAEKELGIHGGVV